MSEFAWLGVFVSSLGTTLALGSWMVMAVPYLDNAPYMTELRRNTKLAVMLGLGLFAIFFGVFYLGALHLNEDTSGPLLAFAAFILALPFSMLLGSETWDRYNPKGMNRVPGPQAIVIATGIGLAEMGGFTLVFMLMFHLN